MDTKNSISIKKRAYELGIVFNINKVDFNWKDLEYFSELKNMLQLRKKQDYQDKKLNYKKPTLLLDLEKTCSIQGTLHLSICLPCYDEEWCEVSGTLRSISKNILICRQKLKVKFDIQVTIYIIQDGWNKATESLMEGVKKELFCPDKIWITNNLLNSKCCIIIPNGDIYYPSDSEAKNEGITFHPIFITKLKNYQKFNSHLLFFSLCHLQEPECVFLTDTGTIYDSECIKNMIEYIYENKDKVVGVTAKQKVMDESSRNEIRKYPIWSSKFKSYYCIENVFKNINWWISPAPLQGFEFESSFILNTAIFNIFEALPVLPGPCQLLWWRHLKDVLDVYFKHLKCEVENCNIIKANTLLVEDRILSFYMIFETLDLKTLWIPTSTFSYEPMMTWSSLLNQRRRWINGTISTYIYYLTSNEQKKISGKKCLKALWYSQLYQSVFQAISPSFFTISLFESVKYLEKNYSYLESNIYYIFYEYKLNFSKLVAILYFLFYVLWVSLSVVIGQQKFYFFNVIYSFYALVNSVVSFLILYTLFFENNFIYIKIIVVFLWFIPLLYSLSLSFKSGYNYVAYSIPFAFNFIHYICFVPAYALTRFHDISWGNRESNIKISNKKYTEFLCLSVLISATIVLLNFIISGIYLYLVSRFNNQDYLYLVLSVILFFPIIIQYLISFLFYSCKRN